MKKRLGGFKSIHVAKLLSDGSYQTPIPVLGAKSIEAELNYESVQFYADNAMDYNDFIFNGGEGTLTVSGLTTEEYQTLFGSTVDDGGVLVKTTDSAPELAILFERNKLGTKEKVFYVIYAAKFSTPSINAQTMEGSVEEETVELTFNVRELADGSVFYMLDSEVHAGAKANAWYDSVQTAGVSV